MKPIIFSGRASLGLAHKIALNNDLKQGELQINTFSNSEIKVRVLSEVKDTEVVVVQALSNPTNDNLMELVFIIDALNRQNVKSITLFIPYFGYARQNMQHLSGESVSMNVVARMLEAQNVSRIITLDIHDEGSTGIFNTGFTNLSSLPMLANYLYQEFSLNQKNEIDYVIVSPDQGGVERARTFANNFYKHHQNMDTVVVEKKRELSKMHISEAVEIFGDVKAKKVILVDDIATSGKTIINAAKLCLDNGATEVSAAVVHPDFGLGVPEIIQNSVLNRLFTTNSIEKPIEDLSKYTKIKIMDISAILVL